jgi:hypothetical protein
MKQDFLTLECPDFGATAKERGATLKAAERANREIATYAEKAKRLRKEAEFADWRAFIADRMVVHYRARAGLSTNTYHSLYRHAKSGRAEYDFAEDEDSEALGVPSLEKMAQWVLAQDDAELEAVQNLGKKGQARVRAWARWYLDVLEARDAQASQG